MARNWLIPGLIILVGIILRFWGLDGKSLWADEIATIASAMGNSIDPNAWFLRGQSFDPPTFQPAAYYLQKAAESHGAFNFAQTAEVLRYNVHPPFFFWLMTVWIHAFGMGEFALRLPAVVFGILSIPAIFLLAREIGDEEGVNGKLALVSAGIMAASGYQIAHSQDARQYTLLILLAVTSTWLMLRLIRQKRTPYIGKNAPQWIAIIVLSLIGLYSQYLYGLFLVFLYGYAAFRKRNDNLFIKKLVYSAIGIGVLFTPWLPYFKDQLAFLQTAGHYSLGLWNPIQLPEILWRMLNDFVFYGAGWGRIVPLVIFGAALLGWFLRKDKHAFGHVSPVLALALFWIAVIVGGQLLLDIIKQSHTVTVRRYLLLASPAYYLLLAYALLKLPIGIQWLKGLAIGVFFALMLWNTGEILAGKEMASDDFQSAGAYINAHFQPGDRVMVNESGSVAVGLAYYLNPDTPMVGIDAQDKDDLMAFKHYHCLFWRELEGFIPDANTGEPLAILEDPYIKTPDELPRRVWMVYSHEARSTRTTLDQWFNGSGYRKTQAERFPGVRLWLYEKASG